VGAPGAWLKPLHYGVSTQPVYTELSLITLSLVDHHVIWSNQLALN